VSYLTYSKFNYGNKDDCGLREFKIRNGFQNVLVPRYFVPLTSWGEVCVRGRLYRDLHQILPGPVIRAAIKARSLWYDLVARPAKSKSSAPVL